MSRINLEIPDSLHSAAGELARETGVTVEQFLTAALAEKVSALAGTEWLKIRAERGDRAKFEEALSRVADVEPEEHDRL